jgi:hypothetical protein
MNVNVKITLNDEQRNALYRRISGKNVKRLISRAEVNQLVQDFIASQLSGGFVGNEPEAPDIQESINTADLSDADIAEMLMQNKLLHSRCNRLQHKLDKEAA